MPCQSCWQSTYTSDCLFPGSQALRGKARPPAADWNRREKSDAGAAELRQILDGGPTEIAKTPGATTPGATAKRKKFSAATIKRARADQRSAPFAIPRALFPFRAAQSTNRHSTCEPVRNLGLIQYSAGTRLRRPASSSRRETVRSPGWRELRPDCHPGRWLSSRLPWPSKSLHGA